MNRFIEAFRNLFRIPDLRNRVLFTLALLAVYRIGAHIPTPGINIAALVGALTRAWNLFCHRPYSTTSTRCRTL